MKHPIRLAVAGVVLLAIGGAGFYVWHTVSRPLTVDAPRPVVVDDVIDTLTPPLASVVEAPVLYDLGPALDSLERAIPRSYGDITQKMQAGDNRRASFAFAVSRAPFRLDVDGMTVSLSTTVEYEARGWYRPMIGPEISAACGTAGVPRPRIEATLISTARITGDWRLRLRTRLGRLEPATTEARDRCRVTPLRIDITDRVLEATKRLLEQNLVKIDNGVAGWDSRSRFEQLWRQLQRPIRFTDSVYMTINPFSAQLGSVTEARDTVVARLRVIASPRVLTGGRPNEFSLMKPIPRLETGGKVGSGGVQVLMEGSLAYPVGSAMLRKVLVGRTVEQAGRRLSIEDVEIFGVGGGRIALGVTIGGAVHGRVYFIGTPSLDRARRELHVPDLDVDVGSANLLVRGLDWLRGDQVRDFLRDRARFSEADLIGRLRELAEQNINRQLTDGIDLSGTVKRAEATTVHATTQELRVRALAEAELKLTISKAPTMPRPPQLPAVKKGGEGGKG